MKKITLGLLALLGVLMTLSTAVLAQEVEPITVDFKEIIELSPQLESEIRCLAKNIYYEAGNESFDGKLAVAQVSVNRMRSGKFPDTICGVVKQKTHWQGRTVCQFSWFCTAKGRAPAPINSENYQESLEIAKRVLLEGLGLRQLKDALYFHATHVTPNWGKPKVAKIGNHIFYRDHK